MSFELSRQDRVQMTQLGVRRKRNIVTAAGIKHLSQWSLPQPLVAPNPALTVEEDT
jgi:hypothetical protein